MATQSGAKSAASKTPYTTASLADAPPRLSIPRVLAPAEVDALAAHPALVALGVTVGSLADLHALAPLAASKAAITLRFTQNSVPDDVLLTALPAVLPGLVGLDLDQGAYVSRGNRFTAKGLCQIARLPKLRWLQLHHLSHKFKAGDFAFLADNKALEALNLHTAGKPAATIVAPLKGLTRLRRLDLSNVVLSDAATKHLGALPLTHLRLAHAPLTDKGLALLGALKTLQVLDLNLAKGSVGDAGIASLGALSALTALGIGLYQGTRCAVQSLAPLAALPSLRTLALDFGTPVHDGWLHDLARSTSLQRLGLGTHMPAEGSSAEAVRALFDTPSLQGVSVNFSATETIKAMLTPAQLAKFLDASGDLYVGAGCEGPSPDRE